jgi:hypothetical protein
LSPLEGIEIFSFGEGGGAKALTTSLGKEVFKDSKPMDEALKSLGPKTFLSPRPPESDNQL